MSVQMQSTILNIKDGDGFEGKSSKELRSRYTLGDALPSNLSGLSIMSPAGVQTQQQGSNSTQDSVPKGVAATLTKQESGPAVRTDPYNIRPLTEEYYQPALEHLRKYFFRDEPLNVDMGLLTEAEDRCVELEEFALGSMRKGVSLMAVSERDELVGVVINCVTEREESKTSKDPSLECANPKFAKILRLLYFVSVEADVFGQFPDVQRVLNISILSVDSNWRGRGIARALTDATAEYAKEHAVQMLRVDCTSHFTALISERLGFHSIYRLPYAQYIPEGEQGPVFKPPPPHLEIKVFVHRVDDERIRKLWS